MLRSAHGSRITIPSASIREAIHRIAAFVAVLLVCGPLWSCDLHLAPALSDTFFFPQSVGELPTQPALPVLPTLPPTACLIHCTQHPFLPILPLVCFALLLAAMRWHVGVRHQPSRLADPPLLPPPRVA